MRFFKAFVAICLMVLYTQATAQNDSTQQVLNFKGNVSITNNGFSVIASFTLGKPATVIIFAVGGKKGSV
jgi:hypothetical protein